MTETTLTPAAAPAGGGRFATRRLVGGLALTQTVGYGVLYYSFAVLLVPIAGDLHTSTAAVTVALTISIVVAAAAAIPVGHWLDRHGGRLLMTAGSLLGVVAVVAWSQVQQVWQLYAVFVLIGLAGAASLYEAAFPVVIAAARPGQRDRDLLTVTIVAGFASSIFFPLTGFLLAQLGWRNTLLALAGLLAVVAVPVHALLLPRMNAVLWRRLAAELLGTGLLVTVVVGSGIMATRLSPDVGLQLLANSTTTALGLAVLILVFGPVSGAHFNPVVSLVDWWLGRRSGHGLDPRLLAGYIAAQVVGAVLGAVLANLMFGLSAVTWSQHPRTGAGLWLGEVVATGGLILLIFALARSGRAGVAPAAIGAYIGAAYWFTSSTSFANPAVTLGRAFTDTFAGIAPSSVSGFVIAQMVGMVVGVAAVALFYPHAGLAADDVVVPSAPARARRR